VKPYVKRGKHDAADAAALCEAVSRPGMTFVSAKSPAEQSALMLVGMRDRLIRTRTQLSNAIRSYASEFGIVAAKGLDKVAWLLDQVASDGNLPLEAKALFELQGQEYDRLQAEIRAVEARLLAWHRGNADSRKLVEVPGIGPLGASRLAMKKADAAGCRSARHFSAWLGLTAKNHSTAGRLRLGGITRAGDPLLRSVLVVGAMAVIRQAGHHPEKASPWLLALLKRKPKKLAAVALANKNARIAWKMMMTGECYDATRALKPIAKAA
jgi:transposase